MDLINYSKIKKLEKHNVESTGYGILTGLGVTAQATPNMTVAIAAGIIHMPDGKRYAPVSIASMAIDAADTVDPRTDVIYIKSTGQISYLKGMPSSLAKPPSIGNDDVKLAEIFVAANATTITSANITDKRLMKSNNNELRELINTLDAQTIKTGIDYPAEPRPNQMFYKII